MNFPQNSAREKPIRLSSVQHQNFKSENKEQKHQKHKNGMPTKQMTNLLFQSNLKKIKKMIKDVEIYQNYKNLEMKVTEIIKIKGISELKTKLKGT